MLRLVKRAPADSGHPQNGELEERYGGELDLDFFSVEATSALLRQLATDELPEDSG